MTKKACLMTHFKNEELLLPFWIKYYTQFFDPNDIYVNDDGSTDNTVKIAREAGLNVRAIPEEFSMKRGFNLFTMFAKQRINELLEHYDCALLAEADDFIVPRSGTLKEFLESFIISGKRFYVSRCVSMVHNISLEPPLVLDKPWLQQRSSAIHIPKFDNPQLWSVNPAWGTDFHDIAGRKVTTNVDHDLLLIDTHTIDFNLCNDRHKLRGNTGTIITSPSDDELREFFNVKFNAPSTLYLNATSEQVPNITLF